MKVKSVACHKVSQYVCVNFVLGHELDLFSILLRLLLVLEGRDGVKDLLGGLLQGDGPHLPGRGGGVHGGGEGVDLGHGEPGQGREHEVEQRLANADHDVLVLKQANLHVLPAR